MQAKRIQKEKVDWAARKKEFESILENTGANMNMIALFHLVEEKIVHLLFIILLRIQAKTSCSLL